MEFEKAFTPALQKKVEEAIRTATKEFNPRPAVDRVLIARTSGKYIHYAQILLTFAPGSHGLLYINLQTTDEKTGLLKTKVHGPETRTGKLITAKEEKRLKRAEKALARKDAKEEKIKAAKKIPIVKFDPSIATLEGDTQAVKSKRKAAEKKIIPTK
ncbi:MAG TPA: hypothetical protein VFE02_16850 [Candidatus Acidoferrales bacterium]|jgi:hypothetical protein|nr:hypothetical protein [Candidatus Acidoferrales bacterium]